MNGKGIWTQDEHDRFLQAIKIYPQGPWRALAKYIGSRSVRQVQTHAQKYHEKIQRRMRGLHKDRKTWARTEHRIDQELLDSCRFAEHMNSSPIARIHKTSPPQENPEDLAVSFKELLKQATNGNGSSPCSPQSIEEIEPLVYDNRSAFLNTVAIKMEVQDENVAQHVDLPSFTESLDFLIEYLSD